MNLAFYGAAGEVTGSNHLLTLGDTTIMIDCGMFQGGSLCDPKNAGPFPYDLHSIDAVFVTHAHLDHVGRIPKLFADGFTGTVYSTAPTRDIATLLFADTIHLSSKEAKEHGHAPLYEESAVHLAMKHWKTVEYNQDISLGELHVRFRDAGHILGSAMLEVEHKGKKLVYSGDLGNSPAPILPDTASLEGIEYLIMEATYGDRNHEDRARRSELLKRTIQDTISQGGVLMIPAFSIERTQELLAELNDLVEQKKIPEVPVFLDSPLAIKVTRLYQEYAHHFNEETKAQIRGGDDIFKFPKLRFTETARDSMAIKDVPAPKIIIAGSGMSNGGRIMHHEFNYLSNPKNTLLIIGFQAVGTIGRMLKEGAKTVTIHKKEIPVRAKIVSIDGYSAHKDLDALLGFIETVKGTLKKVFVVHAEPGAGLFFAQRVKDYTGVPAHVAKSGEVVTVDF